VGEKRKRGKGRKRSVIAAACLSRVVFRSVSRRLKPRRERGEEKGEKKKNIRPRREGKKREEGRNEGPSARVSIYYLFNSFCLLHRLVASTFQ